MPVLAASRSVLPTDIGVPQTDVVLAPAPGRHDPTAVIADLDRWPSGLLKLLSDKFPFPARQTAHRRQQGCTGTHFSPLMAAERSWDSPDEARLYMIGDVSPLWWGYWSQALVVRYEFEGRCRTAFPDTLVRFGSGDFAILEVKPASEIKRRKLELTAIEEACRLHGVAYRTVDETTTRHAVRSENVARMHRMWAVPVTDETVEDVRSVVDGTGPSTFGELLLLPSMSGVKPGVAFACALRGAFAVDLDHGILGKTSAVWPAKPGTTRRLSEARGRRRTRTSDREAIAAQG